LIIKQQWTIEEISIFSNSSHLEWRVKLSDTILKWDYPRTIPARFGLIWFSGFRGKYLNVIFYQNMPNLHNWYKLAERKISQKNPEYMLNYLSLKIEKRGDDILIVHCCFSISQNELNNCGYMTSSLTYIPGFSVKFFFQPIYTNYAN
jgi:hypothetical protein